MWRLGNPTLLAPIFRMPGPTISLQIAVLLSVSMKSSSRHRFIHQWLTPWAGSLKLSHGHGVGIETRDGEMVVCCSDALQETHTTEYDFTFREKGRGCRRGWCGSAFRWAQHLA